MKKLPIMMLSCLFLMTFAIVSFAEDMDKGSMKGSMMEEKVAVENKEVEDKGSEKGSMIEEKVEEKGSESMEAVEKGSMKESNSSDSGAAHSAKASIEGTSDESTVKGTVDFVQTKEGVQVVASFLGVTPAGKHGFHIHQNGSCDEGGKAAGGHFNPKGTDHGLLPRDGGAKAHAGDMGNVEIDEDGNGSLIVFLPGLSLVEGEKNVSSKAVILHAKEDDFGQPTGNAGGRIGCGIITANN